MCYANKKYSELDEKYDASFPPLCHITCHGSGGNSHKIEARRKKYKNIHTKIARTIQMIKYKPFCKFQ